MERNSLKSPKKGKDRPCNRATSTVKLIFLYYGTNLEKITIVVVVIIMNIVIFKIQFKNYYTTPINLLIRFIFSTISPQYLLMILSYLRGKYSCLHTFWI